MSLLIRFEGRPRIILYKRRFILNWLLFSLMWIATLPMPTCTAGSTGLFLNLLCTYIGRGQLPQLVKQVIQFRENSNVTHSKLVWELVEPAMYQYAVGEALPKMVPANSEVHVDKSETYELPLFNKKNHSKIVESVGQHGLLHIQLMPNKYLETIFVEPKDVSIDLILGKNNSLIYEFYNSSPTDTVSITTTCAEDTDRIYLKISANPDDLEYRQYFIKLALKNAGHDSKVMDREIMNGKQVADYLEIAPGTIANWTSEGKIPVVYAGSSPRYVKKNIDKWLDDNPRPKKKKR